MKLATQIVHWPGNDVPACDEHAQKLQNLSKHMGFAVSSTSLVGFPDRTCTNCENEAKKAAGK